MKNKPRRNAHIAWILTIILGMVLAAYYVHADYYKHKEPPPTYSAVLCDGAGHYAVKMPGGTLLYGKDESSGWFTSRQQAINRAWLQYNFHHVELNSHEFTECDK